MCNYKGLRLKGFAEQKSATHLTLQYIIINLVKNFLYVCTEYVSIMKCYKMLYKLMQFSYDGGQKHQKYEIHFELSIVIHIHYPCPNRPGCNTCQCNECNGTCNTMVTNFLNLL